MQRKSPGESAGDFRFGTELHLTILLALLAATALLAALLLLPALLHIAHFVVRHGEFSFAEGFRTRIILIWLLRFRSE